MLTAQQTQLLMDSGSLINNMFGFQSNTNSTSENLMKALNEGNIRDLIPAMAGAVQTANNAASLGGIATPNTNHAALGAAALSLSININKISNQIKNNEMIKFNDLQQAVGDTFQLIGDTVGLSKSPSAQAISLELNLLGLGIKKLGDWLLGNNATSADELKNNLPGFLATDFFPKLAAPWLAPFLDSQWNPWFNLNRDGKYYIYDPIVLDLDGDGIETVAGAQFNGSLFDHDKDGIRTSTGWVKSDDGILVIDRNQDGLINNGGELFGDSVTLKDGTQAKHGYAALAEFDSNGDGKVDSNDIDFNKLQVWRDLNQDGISQKNELFSLADAGVKALNLTYKDTNTSLTGGNILAQTGTYEKEDGSIAQMGDVNFAFDSVYSEYIEKIELTDEQQQIVNLKGIGRVRDLQEAAALSSDLTNTLKEYSSATTKEQQVALLDKLVSEWAKTDSQYRDLNKLLLSIADNRTTSSGTGVAGSGNYGAFLLNLDMQQKLDKAKNIVSILDSFSGTKTEQIYYVNETHANQMFETIFSTYENLKSSIYNGLLLQTRLKEYTNEIAFTINQEGEFNLDFSLVINKFENNFTNDNQNAFIDLAELIQINPNQKMSDALQLTYVDFISHGYATGELMGWIESLNDLNNAKSGIKFVDAANKALTGTALNDTLIGNELNNNLNAGAGNDFILAGAGDDVISGGDGNDILMGEAGNDTLYGNAGNDTLNGGEGNDRLEGGAGDDTYVFAKGHGQDTIYDTAGNDTIIMQEMNYADVTFKRSSTYDLVMSGDNGTNSVTFQNFLYDASYRPETLVFKDRTISVADMFKEGITLTGTDNNDTISINDGIKVNIVGGAGNDVLSGANLDDTLWGGIGNDTLRGNAGNDTLNGGEGNDRLEGGAGDDTYVFAKGHGQDTIYDTAGNDTIIMQEMNYADVTFKRSSTYDLVMSGDNGTNSVTFQNFLYDASYRPETLVFKDRTISVADMFKEGITLTGTDDNDTISINDGIKVNIVGGAGNDVLSGANLDDTLWGGIGNDTLRGNAGNDTLNGGEGNDRLEGGAGDDTYVFAKGHGQDTIYDTAGNDTIIMQEMNYADVTFKRSSTYDLVMSGDNGTNSVTFQNFLYDASYRPETLVFKDRTISVADMFKEGITLTGTDDNDTISINDGIKVNIVGGAGNDVLSGANLDDTLWGGIGNDTLRGNAGNDTLNGGEGNDRLEGGAGDDTYVFAKGHGQDTIYDTAGNDTIIMQEMNYADVTFKRSSTYDLVMSGDNGTNSVTFQNFLYDASYRPETLVFKDRTISVADMFKEGITLTGTDDNDTISINDGIKVNIVGGAGNDVLSGANLDDTLWGGIGNDTLRGNAGNDTLNGGEGNDRLEGGAGDDTYVFAKGHGQDTIYDTAGNDTIIMQEMNYADVTFKRSSTYDLVMSGDNGTNSVTFQNFLYDASYRPETLVFKDRTISVAGMFKEGITLTGTDDNDTISINDGIKVNIVGGAGNDVLSGANLDDTLWGGIGNDTLRGNAGNDTLNGGEGNDRLEGGAGDDTYVFAKGHGQDTIYDTAGNDTIIMQEMNYADVTFKRSSTYDLVMSGDNGTNSVTFQNFLYDASYRPETLVFKDRTISVADMFKEGITLTGTDNNDTISINDGIKVNIVGGAGNDVLSGANLDDTLWGGIGNDTLRGNAGNDTLNGGEGNDRLEGGAGDDTYVFAKGHGQDTIYDTAGNDTFAMVDTIQQDLWFTKSGNNLIISAEVGDSITINNHFYSSSYQVENLKFSDGSNLDVAMVNSLVNSMAAFASQQTSGLTSVELRDKYWAQNIAVGN